MHKLEGHVFERLTPWVHAQLSGVEHSSTGNLRCRPRLQTQLAVVKQRFRSVHSRLARKIWRDSTRHEDWKASFQSWAQMGTNYAINKCLRDATFPALWRLWARSDPAIPDEQDLLNLRPRLANLVVAHVDKLPTEGMIL